MRKTFKDDVSKSAFKIVDGITRMIGKYGEVEEIDGVYDIYFVGPKRTPLTEHKLTAITKRLPSNVGFHRLTGEG
jgi:hypothetical protein